MTFMFKANKVIRSGIILYWKLLRFYFFDKVFSEEHQKTPQE